MITTKHILHKEWEEELLKIKITTSDPNKINNIKMTGSIKINKDRINSSMIKNSIRISMSFSTNLDNRILIINNDSNKDPGE